MRTDSKEYAAYRADARAFLEFCQDHHVRAPFTELALYCWIAHLEAEGVPDGDRKRMRASVERLFRHIGVMPGNEPDNPTLDEKKSVS